MGGGERGGNNLADLHAKHALRTKGLFVEQKETSVEKLKGITV